MPNRSATRSTNAVEPADVPWFCFWMSGRRIEVWVEGFSATGEKGGAWCAGTAEAETLQEACDKLGGDASHLFSEARGEQYGGPGYRLYDRERLTYWGDCKIFDNEADARKRFG
jgi:hypothetical protein